MVVAGYTPSTALPQAVGALTVAFHEGGALRYAGRIGTGYTREISIRDVTGENGELRLITVTIVYQSGATRRTYVLQTYISAYS